MTVICLKRVSVKSPSIRNMGGLKMGLSESQKMELAVAYIRKCDDEEYLEWVINEAFRKLNKLVEAYNEDVQE